MATNKHIVVSEGTHKLLSDFCEKHEIPMKRLVDKIVQKVFERGDENDSLVLGLFAQEVKDEQEASAPAPAEVVPDEPSKETETSKL